MRRAVKQTSENQTLVVKKSFFKGKSVFAVVILFFLLVGFVLHNPNWFPIKFVEIEASYQHISQQELEDIITPWVQKSFFATSVSQLQQQLLTISWVEQATVSRILPSGLKIIIKEQNPVLRFNDDALLNDEGKVFQPKDLKPYQDLPGIEAPVAQAKSAWQNYTAMNAMLGKLNLSIQRLRLTQRLDWTIWLNNGVEVRLGSSDPLAKLAGLLALYPKIFATDIQDVASIDLRYSNGFAVGFKPGKKPNGLRAAAESLE